MNCPDCVNVLIRKKVGYQEELICLLDNRVVSAVIECNRFVHKEVKADLLTEAFEHRGLPPEPPLQRFAMDHALNDKYGSGEPIMIEIQSEPKHRGWTKGKKRT